MPRPYIGATCRGSVVLGTGCGTCERCKDEIAKYALKPVLSDADKATVRGAMLITHREVGAGTYRSMAVAGAVSELTQIITRMSGEVFYCHDGSWCRSLNGSARCSNCPVGNGNPTIAERIALDEGVRREGPGYRLPVSETEPRMSTAERIEGVLGGTEYAQPAVLDMLLEIVRVERADATTTERERCARVADSMDGVQNIGDRIRRGL